VAEVGSEDYYFLKCGTAYSIVLEKATASILKTEEQSSGKQAAS
jgi:hypothetical protein